MQAVTITLNGVEVSGHPGMTILDLARESGTHIPTLCHDPHLKPYGACRICIVEDERNGALLASCVAPIAPGMVINTKSEKVLESRKTIVKLMLASHPDTCMVCDKGNRCQLRQIATDLGIGLIDLQRIPHPAVIQELNPFIERDLSKCIMCAKCIRADQELVVQGAIDFIDRGFASHPATLGDLPLEKSVCMFCGTCVSICPTGALSETKRVLSGTATKVVSTVCSFCGCGCNINLEVSGDRIVRARPKEENSPNGITLCARGTFGFDYVHSSERLTQPLIKVDGEFQPVSWEEAISAVAQGFDQTKGANGADSLAVYGSSKCTNEENYVLQKFARGVLGTNNIDNGGSLYDFATRTGLEGCLRFPTSTNPIDDIEQSQVIMLIGADPVISNPIVGYAIKRAAKYNNTKLILINPAETDLGLFTNLWLRPGIDTDDVLINGIIKAVFDQDLTNKEFATEKTENFDTISKSIEKYTPEHVREITDIPAEETLNAARLFAEANSATIIVGTGITQSPVGSRSIRALANLSLVTGNIGKGGGGLLLLRRENNAQGATDMGCVPDLLPGYQKVQGNSGLSVIEMIEQAKSGKIKAMYIVGENPVANFPDESKITEALSSLDFLVVQDLFFTETAKLANIVLPAASFAEKDGTFTNFERRVQRVRQAVDPIGGSLPDWQIIQKIADEMGSDMKYASAEEIMAEIGETVHIYRGINYEEIESGGVYWPKSETDRAGTRRFYEDRFPRGYGRLSAEESQISAERAESQLTIKHPSGKTLYRFGNGTRSSKSARLGAMTPETSEVTT
ncbi:MAG: molybdopterin-dependent oxidoreductase [Chloroflexi bacterium]|nr:molybdopterin-dependent oxidoreductase [Chloroflexota bacterium]